jgi:hypothetical protein
MKPTAAAILFASSLAASNAQAGVDCAEPMTQWQPRDAVMALAAQNNWQVRRIKIDDGCYEIYATDADGRQFEVKVNPATLAVLEVENKDNDHDDHKDKKQDD